VVRSSFKRYVHTRCGATGYFLKDGVTEIMLEAIETVHARTCFFRPRLAKSVSPAMRQNRPASP
jgi:DNA-binding NarL/FixJ family response regulator